MTGGMDPVLVIDKLHVALPPGSDRAFAVEDVSLRIYPGQTLCVVGESGSGKSVMATAVMGLLARELRSGPGSIVLQGEPLLEASSQRLRPILMTTGAMVLGALPLALATGAGAESRIQIGWVIVGGMSLGTLLTIFVVPTMYALFARKAIPGANTAEAKDAPVAPVVHHEYIAK